MAFARDWYVKEVTKLVKNNPLMVGRLIATFVFESIEYKPVTQAEYRNRRRARRRAA